MFNIVQKVDCVAIIAVDDNGYVTMVEQFRYGRQSRAMEFPIGGCDPKYSNAPEKVARAEMREETRLAAQGW